MNKQKKSVLITDLDNTLFDWFDIWVSTFKTLLDETHNISGVAKHKLIEEIRPVHQKVGTAEYAFVLEHLPSLIKLYGSRENLLRNLDPAIHASRSQRIRHLRLYPGVYDTLAELKCRRTRVIAYTESTEWYSKFRLKRLGLDYFIEALYSPPDHRVPISSDKRTEIEFSFMQSRHTPQNELKPNPKLLLDIIAELGVRPEDCVYIGDSEIKDIEMAYEAGVTSIFAKYGTTHFQERPEDYELLRAVTHWTDKDVERERALKDGALGHKADFEVESFSEILEHIDFIEAKSIPRNVKNNG